MIRKREKLLTYILYVAMFFIILCSRVINTNANVIRDSEIESTIELAIAPLRKFSGLNDLKIIIYNDPSPNAFTPGANMIFISSGMIINFPDPDVIKGVVAHEIGHIEGNHILRINEVIENYRKATLAATIIGIFTPPNPFLVSITGQYMTERAALSYSREFESAADQYAMKLLERSGESSIGLIKFFEQIKKQNNQIFINQYDKTHPLSKDRLLILKSFFKSSHFKKSHASQELGYAFKRAAAKLAAYTYEVDKILDYNFGNNSDEITNYLKAIKCYRIGSFDDALNYVNKLLLVKSSDPFYHELKGQIFFEAGKKIAIHEYDIAIEKRPEDVLLRLGRAIIGITIYSEDPYGMTNYYKDLLFVIEKEPENLMALHYLAKYYEKKGLQGKSYLNTAKIAMINSDFGLAEHMAKAAISKLKSGTPDWYRAKDIIDAINNLN